MPPKAKTTRKATAPRKTDAPNTVPDPVILQLPITSARLDELIETKGINDVLEYNPTIVDPQPYVPHNHFTCTNESTLSTAQHQQVSDTHINSIDTTAFDQSPPDAHVQNCCCFWCCHAIEHAEYGMPVKYDVIHDTFAMFGTFCSMECVAAYNCATHMGSDRMWEVHGWIQMLARRYGYRDPVRPAPCRYLLTMFGGPLDIVDFRAAHRGQARTHVMNIPPFIHVASQMESVNTSMFVGSRQPV